ncbi:hypothetical protein DBR47_03600 [Paucibacter sp. KBW04]|uniref:heparinase II/III family protein n=1 Tax=Paucibacter sp. KBW04 TaxID=2153361 RepID=UPI000F58CC6E|nr:alginate lyase family protein [Paucibacter sp. KBW04]RQO62343.1 hypothetical protein DBR47_03600 [Paucibacter sp. KBW04]
MSSQEAQGRWQWFFSRLSCMSPAEVGHRAVVTLRNRMEQWTGTATVRPEARHGAKAGVQWVCVPRMQGEPFDAQHYIEEARLIASGQVRLFASQRFDVGALPRWNRCPLTGVEGPNWPSYKISLTDRALVGDIKYVWELNRHLHLVAIAQAWALSRDAQYLESLRTQLASWLQQCPCGQGPNWTSSLELAIRLLNWSVIWQLIGGADSELFASPAGARLKDDWLNSINQHVRTIARNYSRHSSANNHLLGELAGVFVATHVWPFWPSFGTLNAKARRELEREIQAQVYADGVLKEQAFEYATFTFDFFLAVERCAAMAGEPVSKAFVERMCAMSQFFAAMRTSTGQWPMVGDADGAEAFRLDPRTGRDAFASMLSKAQCLFQHQGPLEDQSQRDDLLWMSQEHLPKLVQSNEPPGLDFPEGGYFKFASQAPGQAHIEGFVDAGPLGYLGIAAHGHADALQVCLAVDGDPVLVDPGTYSYRADKKWRDYFRGTSAHNTVRINELDQSVSGGRFMWTRKARVFDVKVSRPDASSFELSAWHDGYTRLRGRFKHSRQVLFKGVKQELVVKDLVQGQEPGLIELHWHVHPSWQASLDQGDVVIFKPGKRLELNFQSKAPLAIELISGREDQPLGWYSSAYGEKEVCTTVRVSAHARDFEITTQIEVGTRLEST